MKISTVLVVSLVGVLIVSMADDTEAKLGLALAPVIWAGNLAKDATQTLIALQAVSSHQGARHDHRQPFFSGHHRLRIPARAVSRRRCRGRPQRNCLEPPKNMAAVTPAPIPVDFENELKVQWLPGNEETHHPPPYTPDNAQGRGAEDRVPQLPRIVVPKLLVPKVVMAEVAGSDILQAKADLLRSQVNGKLRHLGSKSAGLLGFGSNSAGHLTGPKYASGYLKGGFRVGHGTGPVADIQLGSDAAPATASPGDARSFDNTEHNATTNHSRPVRSVDDGVIGRYFRFIRANDEGSCVARMICTMAASPGDFGNYGRRVVGFFDAVKPGPFSPVAAYKEASVAGP
ncbi:hypothetical protein MRX96_044856 [Rhipicephalus microplus]